MAKMFFSKWALGLLFLNSLLLMACYRTNNASDIEVIVPPPPPVPALELKTLALGDSYTIGQGVALSDRFPHQLAEGLRTAGKTMAEPVYIAQTGWTTGNLLAAIETRKPPEDFDIVTLLIGVNNQYQGRDTAEYKAQFELCVQLAIKHARGRKDRVFVVSIPDYSVTPFGQRTNPGQISREIDIFNAINARITAEAGISYTDITPGSREAFTNPALIAPDGLHPSGLEYKKWANRLFEVVVKRI